MNLLTWIVAKQIVTGYVSVFSDIQVSWNNGEVRKDCLKKVYPMSRNIVAGFSGSVDMGFLLLSDLNNFIYHHDVAGEPLLPRKISEKWYRRARKIFSGELNKSPGMGCSILMAGVSPLEEAPGNTDLPRSDIVIFNSGNNFLPQYVPFIKTASIGSGNNVEAFVDFLDGSNDMANYASLLGSDRRPGGAGEQLAFYASIMLQNNETPGISKHVHCTLVSRTGFQQFPLDYKTFDEDDNAIEIRMPVVAENYDEYLNIQNKVYSELGMGCA